MTKLIDVAKRNFAAGLIKEAEIIMQMLMESPLLAALDFETIGGSGSETNVLSSHSAISARGLNQGYDKTKGQTTTYQWPKSIIGGTSQVDRALIRRSGMSEVDFDVADKVTATKSEFERMFIKGDRATNPAEFDGLQKILGTNAKQTFAAGSASGGDALNLGLMDLMYRKTYRPTHWVMNLTLASKFDKAARTSTSVSTTFDEFGGVLTTYKGLPIIALDEDAQGNEILPFTESNPGGGSPASTSIYCVSLNPSGVSGIQTSDIDVLINEDQPVTDASGKSYRAYLTQIEWDCGYKIRQLQAATRGYGIKNATIVDS